MGPQYPRRQSASLRHPAAEDPTSQSLRADSMFDDEESGTNVESAGSAPSSTRAPAIKVIPILPSDQRDAEMFPDEVSVAETRPADPAMPPHVDAPAGELPPLVAARRRPSSVRITPLGIAALSVLLIAAAVGWLRSPASHAGPSVTEHADVLLPPPLKVDSLGTSGSVARQRAAATPPPRLTPEPADRVAPPVRTKAAPTAPKSTPRVDVTPVTDQRPVVSAAVVPEPPRPPVMAPTERTPDRPIVRPVAPLAEPAVAPRDERPRVEAVDESAAVRAALTRYADGYTDLDATAVSAVWPSVDRGALNKAFSALDAQQVTFDRCEIQVRGASGRATCVGTAMWLPKVGGKGRDENRTWTFVLKNAAGTWQIVTAEAR